MRIKKVNTTGLGGLRSSLYGALRALFFRGSEKERPNPEKGDVLGDCNVFFKAAPFRINEDMRDDKKILI